MYFDSVEKAVLQLTLEMTRHVRVSVSRNFERVRNALSPGRAGRGGAGWRGGEL